jgi:hypothetical protein
MRQRFDNENVIPDRRLAQAAKKNLERSGSGGT